MMLSSIDINEVVSLRPDCIPLLERTSPSGGSTPPPQPCVPDSFSLSTVGNGSWSWDKSVALTFRVNGGSPIVIHHTFNGAGGAVRDLLDAISAAAGLSSNPSLIEVAYSDGLFLVDDYSDTDMVLDVHGVAIGVSIFRSMPTTITFEPTAALGVGEEDMAIWWGITAPATYHTCGYSIAV